MMFGVCWVERLGVLGLLSVWQKWDGAIFGFAIVYCLCGVALGVACFFGIRSTRWAELRGVWWRLDPEAGVAHRTSLPVLGDAKARTFTASEAASVRLEAERWRGRDDVQLRSVWIELRGGEMIHVESGCQIETLDQLAEDLARTLRVDIKRSGDQS